MASEIASLFVKIGADTKGFSSGLQGVKSDMSGMEKTTAALGKAFVAAFAIGATAVAGFTAVVSKSVSAAADMEQQVADIRSIFGKTAPAAEELNDAILKLGLDPKLKVSATEAAQAIEMLGKNGLTMSEILGGATRNTVLLANATGDNFALAADIATDVMKQFNVSAEDMSTAVDGIVGVTQASKFDINDYALAIAQAGGVASSVGVELDDFNATIAAISPSFGSGSDAGTSFKVFLQRLVPTTNDAKEALMDLGLSTGEDVVTAFFTAEGAMRPMEEIAGNLHTAFSGLSDAQRNEAASTIFGTDAMRAALALADGGRETITKMKEAIGDTSAEEAAAMRMDTFAGAMEIAQGIIETLSISIGQKFLPVLRPLVEKFSELAQTYGPMVVDWFGSVAEKIGGVISNFLDLKLAFEDGSGALMNFLKSMGLNNDIAQKLGKAYWDLKHNFGAVVETIRAALQPVADVIGKFVTWKDVLTAVGILIGGAVLSAIGALVVALWPVITTIAAVTAAVAAFRWAWQNDFLGIQTYTKNTLEQLSNWFFKESGIWKGNWEDTGSYIAGVVSKFFRIDIYNFIVGTWAEIKFQWWFRTTQIKDRTVAWANDLVQTVTNWKDRTVGLFVGAYTKIVDTFNDWTGPTLHKIDVWYTATIAHFRRWYDWIVKYVGDARDWIVGKWQGLLDWWSQHIQPFVDRGRDMMQGLWNGARIIWDRFASWWRGLWQTLTGTVDVKLKIGSPSKEMEKRGAWAVEGFAKGAQQAMPLVDAAMGAVSNGAMGAGIYGAANTSTAPAVSTSRIEELLVLLIQELRAKNMNVTVNNGGGTGGNYGELVGVMAGLR